MEGLTDVRNGVICVDFGMSASCPVRGNLGSAGGRPCQLKASVRTGFFLNASDTARFKSAPRKRPAFFDDHTPPRSKGNHRRDGS